MLNRYWVLILAVATTAGIWLGHPWLALIGVFGLLLVGAELLWMRYCLEGVEYERHLGRDRAFWGEEIPLTVTLTNRKLLPLTWLRTEDMVPQLLPIRGGEVVQLGRSFFTYLRHLLPMLPYERVVRRYSVQCRWRGLFDFGPGRVESGDLLGYNQRSENYRRVDRLIVYPKLLELDIPTPVSRRIIGRQAIDRVILTDPSRTTGVRPYRPGDPLRHVEWRASARSRDLLVRTFEPTTDLSLAIFVNFRAPGQDLRHNDPMELELVVSLAASLARWTLKRGYPVGVYGNGTRGRMQAVRIPVGSHPDHLLHILEALAVATPYTSTSISQIMLAEMRGLPFESSLVLVTAALDAELLAAAAEARRRRPLTIICLEQSDGTPAAMAGSVPHLITVPYDERWPERDALRLGT